MSLCDDVFSTTDYYSGAPREANPLLLLLRCSHLALAEKAGLEPDTFPSLQLYHHMTSSDLLGCMHPQKYININLYQWTWNSAQFLGIQPCVRLGRKKNAVSVSTWIERLHVSSVVTAEATVVALHIGELSGPWLWPDASTLLFLHVSAFGGLMSNWLKK